MIVGNLLLRGMLGLADLVAAALPSRVAYALADLAGGVWHAVAPRRRALVAQNLGRVCEAIGRPSSGAALSRLVRQAFVGHARYYLEMLRGPHYPLDRIDQLVAVRDWERWEPVLRGGVVIGSPHLGNFEPYGTFMAAHDLRAVAPVEEIRPRALFEFLLARRGAGRGVQLVPLARARRTLVDALRRHEIVGLIAERDLAGDGPQVTFFGHRTTMPAGPAQLALMTGSPLLAAACLRIGRDRFEAHAWAIDVPRTGNRAADVATLTQAMAHRFEEAIALAPEQWWGSFQPIWIDQRRPPEAQ